MVDKSTAERIAESWTFKGWPERTDDLARDIQAAIDEAVAEKQKHIIELEGRINSLKRKNAALQRKTAIDAPPESEFRSLLRAINSNCRIGTNGIVDVIVPDNRGLIEWIEQHDQRILSEAADNAAEWCRGSDRFAFSDGWIDSLRAAIMGDATVSP